MVNSKAIYCSTPSATCSTCSTSTRWSTWQNRWNLHRAELVNQGATIDFLMFLSCKKREFARFPMLSDAHSSGAIRLSSGRKQTPSRSNSRGAKKSVDLTNSDKVPFCANLRNPKLKASVTENHWSAEIKQPFLSLSDSQALQINCATGLLLQVDTGWDKWYCGYSGCA